MGPYIFQAADLKFELSLRDFFMEFQILLTNSHRFQVNYFP